MLDIIYYFFWGLGGITFATTMFITLYTIIREYPEGILDFILLISIAVFLFSFFNH